MCAQSHALGTRTRFQLEIPTINGIFGIVYFRKISLESSRNVSETDPRALECQCNDNITRFRWISSNFVKARPFLQIQPSPLQYQFWSLISHRLAEDSRPSIYRVVVILLNFDDIKIPPVFLFCPETGVVSVKMYPGQDAAEVCSDILAQCTWKKKWFDVSFVHVN